MMITHLSLFSGIGGLDLAAEAAEIKAVGQCEFDPIPCAVLKAHWPDVKKWGDIRTLTKESFANATGTETVDIISGGFPCQPFSVAGNQQGDKDDRYLWPEMLRVIKELKPRWVVGENVDGLLSKRFDETLRDIIGGLEAAGYYTRVFSYEAAQVGAWHRRRRTFIVANTYSLRELQQGREQRNGRKRIGNCGADKKAMADASKPKCEGSYPSSIVQETEWKFSRRNTPSWAGGEWEQPEPAVNKRLNHNFVGWLMGFPAGWTDMLTPAQQVKAYGNAVVPQQAYPIFKAITEVEQINDD